MPNHRINFKGGTVEGGWDNFSYIDWDKKVDYRTEGYLSQDMLQLKYDNCLIDLGWYGNEDGHFTIIVIIPDDNGVYSQDSWDNHFAHIPCENQYDMLLQLQRAIDIYPTQTLRYKIT